jgi:hypothetical protein
MKTDPVLERIRTARCEISAQCEHNPQKLMEYYLQRQRELYPQLAEVVAPLVNPPQDSRDQLRPA